MTDTIHGVILLIGFLLLGLGIWQFNVSKKFQREGIKTTATIIENLPKQGKNGVTYTPVMKYEVNGNFYTYTSSISSRPATYYIGEEITILYDKLKPENVKTYGYYGMFRNAMILFSVAMPILIICGGYFLYKYNLL